MFKDVVGSRSASRREIPEECRTILESIHERPRHPCWNVDPEGHDGEYCVYVYMSSIMQNQVVRGLYIFTICDSPPFTIVKEAGPPLKVQEKVWSFL